MLNIKHYADSQRAKLAAVLEREKLGCYYRAVVQGPLTLTWRLLPYNPDTGTIKRLLSLGSVLQSEMLVESVRVQQVAGLIEIQIPSPQPMTPDAEKMLQGSSGMNVAMGLDTMRKPVAVDLSRHGALAWVGPSRRGKTQSMRSTLYSAAAAVGQKLRYAIIAQPSKLKDWQSFDGSKHSLGIASEPGDMVACVRWFAEYARRGADGYRLVLVVDDLPSILAVADIAKDLGFIASNGAGVGVHLWLGTQMLGSNAGSGGGLVENNISARIVYKPASNATGARNAGAGGLDTSNLSTFPGDAIALIDGHAQRVATALCSDDSIYSLPHGCMVKWWRSWAVAGGKKVVVQPVVDSGCAVVVQPVVGGVVGGSTPVVEGGLHLSRKSEPNLAQSLALFNEWERLERSKRKTLISVFGYKDGRVAAWLDAAIQRWGSDVGDGSDEKVIVMEARRKV